MPYSIPASEFKAASVDAWMSPACGEGRCGDCVDNLEIDFPEPYGQACNCQHHQLIAPQGETPMTTDTPEMRKARGIPSTAVFAAHLENTTENHDKFWVCYVVFRAGRLVVVTRWGRKGTSGQTKDRNPYGFEGAAILHARRLVEQKLGKGYVDPYVQAPPQPKPPPVVIYQSEPIQLQCANCDDIYPRATKHTCPPEPDEPMLGERFIDVT